MLQSQKQTPLTIIVHGGAGNVSPHYHTAALQGCEAAATVGWHVLQDGGSALAAVEAAVRVLEDDPTFNAGTGSVLNADGEVEMDAGIMDGATLQIGAVAAIQHYAHPISLARRVMEASGHHILAAAGAERFAQSQGFAPVPNQQMIVPRRREQYEKRLAAGTADTVGALALDAAGNVAAANSTGGVNFKLPGRVGDSPLAGAGFYADNHFGAVATTGQGEQIMRVGLAWRAMQALEQGATAQQAAQQAIVLLQERVPDGRAGLIVVDMVGRVGIAHCTRDLPTAYWRQGTAGPVRALRA